MKAARVIAMLGVFEIGAAVWAGVGVYLGWWPHAPQAIYPVFALGVLMLVGGAAFAHGWSARGDHELAQRWRYDSLPAAPIASLPTGGGSVDASLDSVDWTFADKPLPRRVVSPQCLYATWAGDTRARCRVYGCGHVAVEPRGPGWSRAGNGEWLCPCDIRHTQLAGHPTGAL